MQRRHFIQHAGLLCAASAINLKGWSAQANWSYQLTAQAATLNLLPGGPTPALGYNGQFPAPVLRAKQGKPFRVEFTNLLTEPTTIHWHGLRIPNAMDGVPHFTQPPIQPGQRFVYEFTPKDAGTFWYHPHTNSLEQLSRGLMGVLIVEEARPLPFGEEIVLGLKDWLLNSDGSFAPFTSLRAAARVGTLGNITRVNGLETPQYTAQGLECLRLRIANMDNTRIYDIGCNMPAQIIALEGNPLKTPHPLEHHLLGPGMRVDLAIQLPREGQLQVFDQKGKLSYPIASVLISPPALDAKTPAASKAKALPKLAMNPIARPNLKQAKTIPLLFEWAGELSESSAEPKLWLINREGWAGGCEDMMPGHLPTPLFTCKKNGHYILDMHNASPYPHPVHMHGHTFLVYERDGVAVEPYFTDTILLLKYEKAKVAFVADNPGDWMFHCHIIEHMKTGFMGFFRVT
ncbi:MAG TPA: multicopper oxidase family protein [Cellvibrionaceae bacterium]